MHKYKLIDTSINTAERTRLYGRSGAFSLRALPSTNHVSSFISVNVVIRIDCLCHHGLSCSRSVGRIPPDIRRALVSVTAGVPAVLEPNDLVHSNGKNGTSLMMECLCFLGNCALDSVVPSHVLSSTAAPGAAAGAAETLKKESKG
ncbi:unnamed protein product [Chrysodeixis includens]|uniref:Uncharacterized protein n=1 Tax=Chrysodeixis includens TaxID=689277 RepID=A0A9N8KU25_CHRIL|nr:unnamed protein product [Chrysodeixis includens]